MRQLVAFSAVVAAISCSPHKVARNPAPPVEVEGAYQNASDGAALPEKWWQDFGDADLDALVERVLDGNLRLRGAVARVEQARAVATQARSGKWPQINANASVRRSKNRIFFGPQDFEFTQNQYSASVSAGYEVDLFQRIGAGHESAKLQTAATRDDMEAVAITLVAETAEAWFDLLVQRERRALLEEQLGTNETFVELVTLRFTQGLGASAVDVFQARSHVTATKAQLAVIESLETLSEYRLAVLLGEAPGSLEIADRKQLPELPPLPGTGVPADLLFRRPDVRAIRRRVEAADWKVASAVADRLPKLSLSGDLNTTATDPTDLIVKPLYNLVANLIAPIFDGGRRAAEVDRTEAAVDELSAAFGQVLLGALLEVESALVLEKGQLDQIAELEVQVEISKSTLKEARNRYREGITDFLPVLTALRTLHASEQSVLGARRQLLSYRIQLCRALGGTWTHELKKDGAK